MVSNQRGVDGECIFMHYTALMLMVLVERIPPEGDSYPPITYGELAKAVNFCEYPGYRDNEEWRKKAEEDWSGHISEILALMGKRLAEHSKGDAPNIQSLVVKQGNSYSKEQEEESVRVMEFDASKWHHLAMEVARDALKKWRDTMVGDC